MDALGAFVSGGVTADSKVVGKPNGAKGPSNEEAAKQMEALFAAQLIKAMRKTVPDKGLMSGGKGEEVMQSLMDEALAMSIASRGSLGLAPHMLEVLNRTNPEGTSPPDSDPENGR